MRLQKLTATLLAATLIFALLLAGCQDTPDTPDGGGTTTTATTAAPAVTPSDWQQVTTTATAPVTTATPSTAPVSELLGHVENADGTFTDKSDGTVFIDEKKSGATEGDLVYHLAGGIQDAAVTTVVPEGTAIGTEFALYTSADGKTWEESSLLACSSEQKADGVSTRTGYFYFNAPVSYVKVQLVNNACEITRVRVNNVQKMHHPYEKVENRDAAAFYVDAQNGDDNNDGLSPDTAYKTLQKAATHFFGPGDKLLLKKGGTFVGNVTLQGLGLANRRIYIGAYGEGADPVIAGESGTAVTLKMDHVTFENIEITNPNGLSAMRLENNHTGAVKGIIIQNCYIHDVNNEVQLFTYSSGGIHYEVHDKTAPTWFEDLVIRQNTFQDLARTAVYGTTSWAGRDGVSGGGWGSGATNNAIDDDTGWFPAKNVSITDNTMHSTQGDSVVIIGARNLRIARNFVYNAFCVKSEVLTHILQTQGTNRAAVALWSLNCNDVYVEHNEVSYTNLPSEGRDGEAFDIDAAHKRVFIQYNYSHHNEGGFLLICGVDSTNRISADYVVRYNLSVEDATLAGQGVFMATNTTAKLDVYNNTIVQTGNESFGLYAFGDFKNYYFRNNIFSGARSSLISIGHGVVVENVLFDNNIFTDGAYLPTHVFYGSRFDPADTRGFTVTDSNRSVEVVFRDPDYTPTDGRTPDRAAAIAAFTPKIPVDGAYKTPSAVDINGDPIEVPFYGCVKPRA